MEAYIIQINGVNCLVSASCLIEAKLKAKKTKGKLIGTFNIEDYNLLKK
jgi:hypothetical protein